MEFEECFGGFATETALPELSGNVELDQLEGRLIGNPTDERKTNLLVAVSNDVRVPSCVFPIGVQIRIGKTLWCSEISEVWLHHAPDAFSRIIFGKVHVKRHGRQRIVTPNE